MRIKRIHAVKNRRKQLLRIVLTIVLVAVCVLFVKNRKEMLVREGSHFLQKMLSRETELDVKIGKISGKVSGSIQFNDVRIEDPVLPTGQRVLFTAKRIEFHYRWIDFLSKTFNSKIEIVVEKPQVYWQPTVRLRSDRFPSLGWMRHLALSERNNLKLHVKDLAIFLKSTGQEFEGINFDYQDDSFQMQLPLRHLEILGSDVTTFLNIKGRLELGLAAEDASVKGNIVTEGTVINWSPLPQESSFDFIYSRDSFQLLSSNFLRGIEITGDVNFRKDEIRFLVKARNFPVSNFDPFVKLEGKSSLPGRLDLDADFRGNISSPHLEVDMRLHDGWIGRNAFKAMDIHVEGVYPTVKLTDSRILTKDGSTMRFADKTLEINELFSDKTYQTLVSETQQDSVVWGDWEFKRPREINDQPEFLMQRSLGDKASLRFTQYNQTDSPDPSEDKKPEIGFEYHLRAKDSLKLGLREDEKFVGVERKMSF